MEFVLGHQRTYGIAVFLLHLIQIQMNTIYVDWNITEYTPLTVPVKWNSCDVENALSLQENMNREDRLVASRYMPPSVSVMRDRDIAPVVEILETRST